MHIYLSDSEALIFRKKINALLRRYPHCKSNSDLIRYIINKEFAEIVKTAQKEYPELSIAVLQRSILEEVSE